MLTEKGYRKWVKYNTNLLVEENKIMQFPQELRLKICKNVQKLTVEGNESKKELMDLLEIKINESGVLNRLSFLLNNEETQPLIQNYLKKLIDLVKYVKLKKSNNENILINQVKRELNLAFHKIHITEIIEKLEEE